MTTDTDVATAKADADARAHKIQLQQLADAQGPYPHVSLRKFRFLVLVILGVGATGTALTFFLDGITIEHGIYDPPGSSAHADQRVELFQSIGGFVWAAVGLLLEKYFEIWMAAMIIYFMNQQWYPGERVTEGPSGFKRRALFWFIPLMMYVVNIGISSIFVEHKLDKVERAFNDDDLKGSQPLTAMKLARASNATSTSVVDTVLRRLVTKGAVPFHINTTSTCSSVVTNSSKTIKVTQNDTVLLPSMMDLQSTFVSFGFAARPWNLDALPTSLTPTHTVTLVRQRENQSETQAQLDAFLTATGVAYTTLGELLTQGHTLHGKASTDSNLFESYVCDPDVGSVDPTQEEDPNESTTSKPTTPKPTTAKPKRNKRRVQTVENDSNDEGEGTDDEEVDNDEGKVVRDDARLINGMTVDKNNRPLCYGAFNYLANLVDMTNVSNHNVQSVFKSVFDFVAINMSEIQITLDTFALSPQLRLTTMTIDLPYDDTAQYVWVDLDRCDPTTVTFRNPKAEREIFGDKFDEMQEYLCSGRIIAYDGPYQTCGERNCVVEDYSTVMLMTKQIQFTPYMSNCTIGPHHVTYDKDISSWFPSNCSAQTNAAFLYGVGSYFEGTFEKRGGVKGPQITNPRRHYVVTFAKLEWTFEDLSQRFGAACDKNAGTCQGLLHPLQNIHPDSNGSRVLIVGEHALPKTYKRRTLRNPLPLITLREPKMYENAGQYTYYMYEYIDMTRMNTTYKESDGLGLDQGQCSVYIDAYLNHVKNNHYYIQDPRQPLYTAALYYIFQDAQVKYVTLPDNNNRTVVNLNHKVIGTTRLTGDLETKEIRYSTPLVSVISTGVGMLILIVYMGIILQWPRDAVKRTTETNPAAHYADVLVEDYPERVHTRQLRLVNETVVEMDDYEVQRIVFRNTQAPDQPIVLE